MIRDRVGTRGSERTADDREAIRYLHVAGLHFGLSARRVEEFVDAILVIVGAKEDHVEDAVVGDELEQIVPFGAVTTHVGFAAVGVYGRQRAGECTTDRAELVDWVGNCNKFPERSGALRVQQSLLKPGELSGA